MQRRKIFSGNWKMYKTYSQAEELATGIMKGTEGIKNKEIIIFPPSIYARDLIKLCESSSVNVGIQNMYFEEEGAFTGEISPLMVKDIGCKYILIGHSERRHVFGETDDDVNKKVKAAFSNGLEPVVCVGELLEEREDNKTEEVIKRQTEIALKDISPEDMKKVIIAYEPVWAIGTGKVATPEIAEDAHVLIREIVKNLYNENISESLPILYGGSVKPDNIKGLYSKENIDGVLVGGASLKVDSFIDIINVE